MKVIWDYLSEADKQYLLSQVSLVELYQELHKRAQGDDDEDLEEGEEEEMLRDALIKVARRWPHWVVDRRM